MPPTSTYDDCFASSEGLGLSTRLAQLTAECYSGRRSDLYYYNLRASTEHLRKLATPSDNTVVCKNWMQDKCQGGNFCRDLHILDMRRIELCHFAKTEATKGGLVRSNCTNPECFFRHVDLKTIPRCPDYEAGFCPRGFNCPLLHERGRLCPCYMAGFCPKGPDCDLAHPPFKLPGGKFCTNCLRPGHTADVCRNAHVTLADLFK